jgi:hypothetical protein
MAKWVELQDYTEEREGIWVNLDKIVMIKGFEFGSTLYLSAGDANLPMKRNVWDMPGDIFRLAKDSIQT